MSQCTHPQGTGVPDHNAYCFGNGYRQGHQELSSELGLLRASVKEWEEWSNSLAELIPEGDESKYSNPEAAQESIIQDVLGAYVEERSETEDGSFDRRPITQNDKGEWVPAIPLPKVTRFSNYRCTCRKKAFWTLEEYKQHWVYEHVYMGRPERP